MLKEQEDQLLHLSAQKESLEALLRQERSRVVSLEYEVDGLNRKLRDRDERFQRIVQSVNQNPTNPNAVENKIVSHLRQEAVKLSQHISANKEKQKLTPKIFNLENVGPSFTERIEDITAPCMFDISHLVAKSSLQTKERRSRGIALAHRRLRRSRSAGDQWFHNRDALSRLQVDTSSDEEIRMFEQEEERQMSPQIIKYVQNDATSSKKMRL